MIEAYHSDWDPQILRGSSALFDALPEGPQITVPEGAVWELRGQPRATSGQHLLQRGDYIRLVSASITFVVLVVFLWRKGLLRDLNIFKKRVTLRLRSEEHTSELQSRRLL